MGYTPMMSLRGDVLPSRRTNLTSSTMFFKSGLSRGVSEQILWSAKRLKVNN